MVLLAKNGIMLVSTKFFHPFRWYHVGILKTVTAVGFELKTAKTRLNDAFKAYKIQKLTHLRRTLRTFKKN